MNLSSVLSTCELCQHRYHLLRRKKQCDLCGQSFCSKCAPKMRCSHPVDKRRACVTCLLIIDEQTTRHQLLLIRVKDLRAYLVHSRVISRRQLRWCLEKEDLIHFIQARHRARLDEGHVGGETSLPATIDQNPPVTSNENQNPSVDENETRVLENGLRDTMARHGEEKTFVRVKLSDLSSLESIDRLTIRQLRDLLNQNFVSMKGCVERSDLIAKLQLLYRDHQRSTVMDARTQSDDNLCKICLDAPIDCVFIDCGHLCACLPCGRQLSECPLCRSYIVRLVRIFKS